MAGTLRASDVVVGLLTENTPRMLTQAVRLVRSIRWFGGELSTARVVVAGVGPLQPDAQRTLTDLGAEVRTVTRFHRGSPAGNRLQLLAALLDAPEKLLLLLDCDTLIVRDPLPFLRDDVVQGKIAPTPTVNDEVFDRLFAHFGLPKPPRAHVTGMSGEPTIAYINAGVLAIPKKLAPAFEASWRKFNLAFAEQPELAAPCHRHIHQAALALALVESGVPYAELPEVMNYQINASPGSKEADPVIIHYHHLATDDGFLLPCPYPGAQRRIELFHDRMRAEGFAQQQAAVASESRAIVILGMHRSGTSLVTDLVRSMGGYIGQPDELTPPDMFNPGGYWEHRNAVRLDDEILAALSANWTDRIANAGVSRLSGEQRASYVARAKSIAQSLQGHGSFLLKDPRMSLLFPLWREALGEPICVIAWRHPLSVARSLMTRDGMPLLAGVAAWEHHYRAILRDTDGLPRVLVSYEELLAEPARVARELHGALAHFGASDLQLPPDERLRQIVNPDFNRSGGADDEQLLDADQRALLADLRSGAALQKTVVATAPRTLALLAQFGAFEKRHEEMQRDLGELDSILGAVFESRSWRIGHRLTSLLRVLRRGNAVSALDRWQASKRRRR